MKPTKKQIKARLEFNQRDFKQSERLKQYSKQREAYMREWKERYLEARRAVWS